MMNPEILKLEEVRRTEVAVAGGKGANLGEMLGNGFPVPPGFVVTAHACEAFFKDMSISAMLDGLTDAPSSEVGKRCDEIRNAIEAADLPLRLEQSIMAAHGSLVENRGREIVCAVRSSATAEDLGDASFAGQHDTYYYVGADTLVRMIKHCWASLWRPEAVSYRNTQGIDHGTVFMAVVVQEMILSDISGVTFSANPVTGSREEIVTESSWGMGAAIVDGRVTPDRYVVNRKTSNLVEKRIAEKRFMVPARLEKGKKTRLQEVPHALRQKETLSLDQARMVSDWAIRAEAHFKNPQDIEWAMADGAFFLLQSRPITVMGREDITRDVSGRLVLFKSLIENFTEPLTPLTIDIWNLVMPPTIVSVRGWVYINLGHLRPFIPFKISDEELADLVYISHGAAPPTMKLSMLKLPFFILFSITLYLLFGVTCIRTRSMPDGFMDPFRTLAKQVDADSSVGPLGAMARLWFWTRLFDPIGRMATFVNLTTALRYPIWRGILQKLLRRWAPDIREDAEELLCSGAEGILSADMGRGIWSLAQKAKEHPKVREIIVNHKPDQVLDQLRAEPFAAEFLLQLDRFLSRHGHRALKELELRSVRWEENPAPVLGMVRNYMLVESDPMAHEEKVAGTRKTLEKDIRHILSPYPMEKTFKPRWRLIQYARSRAAYFTKQRENSRFYHIMAFYMVRKKILKIEKDLLARGELKCRDDIFFLDTDELKKLNAGDIHWRDVEDRIRERRMTHIRLCKMVPPKTIGIEISEKPPARDAADEDALMLKGQSASPGACQGTARVILDPSIDIELKPGEILVAPYTDPAWTPLFLTAGAAVVEVGSYLSHAGTVAREFGMPCVVDVSDCTRKIQSGVLLTVDGDHGVVRLKTGDGGIS